MSQILYSYLQRAWHDPQTSSLCMLAGVRTSLVVCFVLHTACRLAMAVTTSRHVMLAVLLGPETMAGALGVPVLTIGIKRFTTQASRRDRVMVGSASGSEPGVGLPVSRWVRSLCQG